MLHVCKGPTFMYRVYLLMRKHIGKYVIVACIVYDITINKLFVTGFYSQATMSLCHTLLPPGALHEQSTIVVGDRI